MKIFFDTEFTGLRQDTTLISIGLISEDWKKFYAEFTDYNIMLVDDWIQKNVIENLSLDSSIEWSGGMESMEVRWDTEIIRERLRFWLSQFESVEMWSDCLSYDWVLFNTLLADYSEWYPQLPSNINYIPFDICTLFKIKWVEPDINREEFAGIDGKKHNALHDAKVIQACYNKLR